MKNRDYKEFSSGEIYHIYNRGVGKMRIFESRDDCNLFLSRLKENLFPESIDRNSLSKQEKRRTPLPSGSFNLISYCLMPNHFHLLIQQNTDLPITKLISKVCTSFSMIFNKKHERVGGLFQDQFKAVRIENNEQLLWTSFYIHNNPRKAGIVQDLEKYPWNSYLEYSLGVNGLCKKELITDQFNNREKYLDIFREDDRKLEEKMIDFQDLFIDLDEVQG